MAQTPQQRKANEKFAKREEAKRGKPEKSVKKQKFKSPISQGWLIVIGFAVFGGIVFELIRMFFWGGIGIESLEGEGRGEAAVEKDF